MRSRAWRELPDPTMNGCGSGSPLNGTSQQRRCCCLLLSLLECLQVLMRGMLGRATGMFLDTDWSRGQRVGFCLEVFLYLIECSAASISLAPQHLKSCCFSQSMTDVWESSPPHQRAPDKLGTSVGTASTASGKVPQGLDSHLLPLDQVKVSCAGILCATRCFLGMGKNPLRCLASGH